MQEERPSAGSTYLFCLRVLHMFLSQAIIKKQENTIKMLKDTVYID